MNDREYEMVSRKIGHLLDLDLSCYKEAQMRRRLATFISRSGCESTTAFVAQLQRDKDLLSRLRTMLTINVTEFFRDAPHWQRLREEVLPMVLARKSDPTVWSAGCSHGGEPYSVAMLLAEAGATRASIIATDIDPGVLAQAKAGGPYRANDVVAVPPEIREAYFEEGEDGLRVSRAIKRRVQFRELNLLRDRFPTNVDLLICRNVIIYFTDDVKTDLMRRFHAALRPGGILFIGATESLLNADQLDYERVASSFYRRPEAAQQRAASRAA